MSPRVSVLIPAYNAESTVAAAIASVQRQTMADFEAVIVDDGSTDRTSEILESLSVGDSRLRVVRQPQSGIISALNNGIELCRGELVARMDADDISHPKRLELQAALMDARPEVSVCSSLVRMFPRRELMGGMIRYEEWLNSLVTTDRIAQDMLVESPVAHPSVMLRHGELVALGGYQERGWAEDYDLWLRYHTAGKLFAKVPRMLLCWRQIEGRLTFTDSRYSVENFLRAKAHYIAKLLAGSDRPIVLWGAGKTGRRITKHLSREGLRIECIVDIDRLKIGHTLRGLPIVSVDYLEDAPGTFVISAVSSHGARGLIRDQLDSMGFIELRDYVCAA